MTDVTHILRRIENGDRTASEQLLPLVYHELRRLAAVRMTNERSDHTLDATALVHEAYIRLVENDGPQNWQTRGHFYSAAAEAMRRILVENARRKAREKHGGRYKRIPIDQVDIAIAGRADKFLRLDEALQRLTAHDVVIAELVKLRYFAGMTIDEAAESLGISAATANRYWSYARAWLQAEIDCKSGP